MPNKSPRFDAACRAYRRQFGRVRQANARPGRLLFLDAKQDVRRQPVFPFPLVWGRSGQQLVQQHSQGVHVGPGVDVVAVRVRLLRAHVVRGPDDDADLGEECALGRPASGRLRQTEIDDLGYRRSVVNRHEDVGRFQVPVDDSLLVGVLNPTADLGEQFQSVPRDELVFITEPGDRHAPDQFHDEERAARWSDPRVENPGDVGVVHQGQRFPLGLESGDDLAGVHPGPNDLQGNLPPYREGLLGRVDNPHPALTEPAEECVRADRNPRGVVDFEVEKSARRALVPDPRGSSKSKLSSRCTHGGGLRHVTLSPDRFHTPGPHTGGAPRSIRACGALAASSRRAWSPPCHTSDTSEPHPSLTVRNPPVHSPTKNPICG